MSTRVVVCCGSGGVGKTTSAAALSLKFANEGRRVAVLTIDPARRLADALSVGSIGNEACRVPLEGPGSLDAMMLDAKGTFDDIVRRFSPDEAARERIMRNHYYHFVSARLAGVHEYMAMERLLQLVSSGRYDVVVLDTPPARHAMDFLTAPDKLARLMDEGVMRWLTLPNQSGGWRMIERGSEVLARVLENVVGEGTIREIAEFFSMFQALWEGFRDRSMRVRALLHEGETAFVLVTTPSPASRAEALDFLKVLKDGKLPFSGFLLNRCLLPAPQEVPDFGPAPAVLSATEWGQITQQLSQLPKLRTQLVRAQEDAIAALMASAPASAQAWRLPELEEIQAAQLPELQRLLKLSQSLPGLNILFKH